TRLPAIQALLWFALALILGVLYLPLVPPLLFSIGAAGAGGSGEPVTLRWYASLTENAILAGAVGNTIIVAFVAAIVTPALGLLAAMAVRELRVPRLILLLALLPLFIPGVSMGLATALFFRQLDIAPALWTICLVHVLWAL